MRLTIGLGLAALGFAVASSAATAQQLYRWVDKDGRIHYTQQPPPRDTAKNVQQKSFAGSVVESGQIPFAVQQAIKNYPVILYTSPDCKQGCTDARELLTKRGVPYREVAVSDSPGIELLKSATGDNKVPSITVGKVVQKGFESDALHGALDTAGYPRTSAFVGNPPVLPAPKGAADASKASPTKPGSSSSEGTRPQATGKP